MTRNLVTFPSIRYLNRKSGHFVHSALQLIFTTGIQMTNVIRIILNKNQILSCVNKKLFASVSDVSSLWWLSPPSINQLIGDSNPGQAFGG